MRKDVKLGFAIGGVLLAVLIVYVLVVPGGKDQRLTSATDQATAAKSRGDAGVKLEPVPPAVTPTTQPVPGNNVAGGPPPAPPVTVTPPAGGATDPFAPDPPVASGARKDLDWSKLLNEQPTLAGTQETPVAVKPVTAVSNPENKKANEPGVADITKPGPTPMQQLPVQGESSSQQANATKPEAAPAPSDPPTIPPPVSNNDVATTPPSTGNEVATQPPAAPTSVAQQQQHIVETGETFSTIALKYYGNANLYGALMRANPSIEPTRLRPGMKVTIPSASEVKPAMHAAPVDASRAQVSSARVEQPLNPETQYRVQPGDSLYSIAKKLYGRFDKQDAIYAANKATIGEDMHRLKVGQVLTLPEPPTKK